jgi:integrase/recombinase XerD
MKTVHTFSILFWIRRKKIQDGKAPVYARVTIDGMRSEISIKRSISPCNWNPKKGSAKGNKEESRMLNDYIELVRNQIYDCYQQLQQQKKSITADTIKKKYLGQDEKEHTVISTFEYHNSRMHTEMDPGSTRGYITTLKFLKLFLSKEMNAQDVFLSQLNYKFLIDFQVFVKTSKEIKRPRPCNQNGSIRHVKRLKKVINMAIKNEWLNRDPFVKYKFEFDKFNRGYLTADQMAHLEKMDLKSQTLTYIRDVFIFCCYTGLSYIDAFKLAPESITIGIDGGFWISIEREKTDNPVKVPLLSKPLAILKKYKDHPMCKNKNRLLPVYSNTTMNTQLKTLAKLCSIKKNVTFHMARHSFATTVTLTNGVPIESVSAMLGHSSIKTTEIYAKIVQSKVNGDMAALRAIIEKGTKRKKAVMAG